MSRLASGRGVPTLEPYRIWFRAAAVYNLIWGALVVAWPALFFRLLSLPMPDALPLWQVVGMMVMVYAPAYWWASRDPERHAHLIVIALLGKVLGPIGFVWGAVTGQLPPAFGWIILTNDLVWWVPFFRFVRHAARLAGGWHDLLMGRPLR